MKTVLFVCTGNTCRSPMAEALFKDLAKKNGLDDIKVMSAGLAAIEGDSATPQAIEVMERRGVDLSDHRARNVDASLVEEADLILTMTDRHKSILSSMYPEAASKIHVLKEYVEGGSVKGELAQILDPFGQPVEVYESCARELEEALTKLIEKLKA
ncbi:MAG: low molecular weight protein arginine phosphatase [Caldicoprobacter oshimai]|uniref:Protein-tyrosine phosphatase n=1 Tax=Caldicoprobacter faecalis TaxID=937334 RepID=A0A1I5VX10_9FIRM|nr:low molecular weight protein arginine phosphatase [Caldicoprobacter faecalis]PZN11977.1 MAG: low molecular weight protein arginine phosphatase [Caldicoprobacter oshimai]SFQ11953.1 protein-tyrosine phosphatase [Caldicoprobacter faecalis]